MVVEHAEPAVAAGRENDFEAVFDKARAVPAEADGFRRAQLLRREERPRTYLLLVGWESTEAHTVGFRESELFARRRGPVGAFLTRAPTVEHYRELSPRRVSAGLPPEQPQPG
ncbi:antibiotic biosynthesis monooxygenase family protein [Streptomyces sp. NPDC020747]|uniref:antibiotic biosynthesis monooxygenase family protein n=1 Tax=Streptomyces sp. NPDC020747 TaxID=3365086 RepID=UPI0037B60DB8